jgi:cytochrome oxidase Cu insertion factor (SCO1/SenC/PrrC family)
MFALAVAVVLLVVAVPWFPLSSRFLAQAPNPASAAAAPLPLQVGDIAPDFTLRDQTGKEVSLKDFRGKKTVVLAFYVFAFSGG